MLFAKNFCFLYQRNTHLVVGVRIDIPDAVAVVHVRFHLAVVGDGGDGAVRTVLPLLVVLVRLYEAGKLRPELRVTAILPAAPREGIVAALKLARDLFVGRPTPGHQHHVKTRQSKNWNRQQRHDPHQNHAAVRVKEIFVFF